MTIEAEISGGTIKHPQVDDCIHRSWHVLEDCTLDANREIVTAPQSETESVAANGAGNEKIRTFESGATRDTNEDKLDYEGFLSPIVVRRFAKYMHKHRVQSDGTLRDSDNWQKGMPLDSYMESGWRHFMDWWGEHRGIESREGLEDALCALLFNVQGYLFEILQEEDVDDAEAKAHTYGDHI